jgi:hypothetical protein
LPGDTADSVRRGIEFLSTLRPSGGVQVFNLSILPGTVFREQAHALGLEYQPRPPYYVLHTPTLSLEQLAGLMEEAQEALGIEFDPWPAPAVHLPDHTDLHGGCLVDLDVGPARLPPPERRAQAFLLWLRSGEFGRRVDAAAALIAQILADNPHTILQVTLEPTARPDQLTGRVLEPLLAACFRSTSYLDRFYSLQPAGLLGAERLVVLVPAAERARLGLPWARAVGQFATLVWSQGSANRRAEAERSCD